MSFDSKYANTHDMHLPEWGPYSKLYYGLSHIADQDKGLRFDFFVAPSFYRSAKYIFPDALQDCGVHCWETTEDLSYYSYRYEMEWKDRVYADVSYYTYDENTRVMRCSFVNQTDQPQTLVLNLLAGMETPNVSLWDRTPMEYAHCHLPEDAVYIDALDYSDLRFHTPRPTDHLVYGGLFRGEERKTYFVKGSALAQEFGNERGDMVSYRFQLKKSIKNAVMLVRYSASLANIFEVEGSIHTQIALPKTEGIQVHQFPIGGLEEGNHEIKLTAYGAGCIAIDGFVLCEEEQVSKVSYSIEKWNRKPEVVRVDNGVVLKYPHVSQSYGIKWQDWNSVVKQYFTDHIAEAFRKYSAVMFENSYDAGGDGHYTNASLFSVPVQPHTTETIYALITCGQEETVVSHMKDVAVCPEELERLYHEKRAKRIRFDTNSAGKPYEQGISLMAATIQNNIVFPIYLHGKYIRHSTPGKWWDCLYTWDSGFIGLALSMFSKERALDLLNAYMTEPGFPHAAFVHFGSPVPVQFYLFMELMNRYGTSEHLAYFYPRLKQYYEFLAGKGGGSSTNRLGTDLLCTWDYFYNSGGWDDYPPQEYMHKHQLTDSLTAVVTNCHVIRIGKMMAGYAKKLGMDQDASEYLADGKRFAQALQTYAWDEESGYFGYVVHDKNKKPTGILRYQNGENFNMGLDGIYPLVAGIVTKKQKNMLLSHLKSDKELWTEVGISTVDQSAPYFNPCGYWNGAVWMPHQWFIFKTMLDMNETEMARKIALTALEAWKKETDLSYHCYEHFLVQTGRGAGWHDFSALSGPVVNWFHYYFVKGQFTCGFEVWAENQKFNENATSFSADLTVGGEDKLAVLLSLQEGHRYHFTYCGKRLKATMVFDGVFEIVLPAKSHGTLTAVCCQ